MSTSTETIEQLATREYKYGFDTDVEADTFAPGLNEDVDPPALGEEGRARVAARVPPEGVPRVAHDEGAALAQPQVSTRSTTRTSATTRRRRRSPMLNSLDEVDPEVRKTFEKLGIPLEEQKLLAGRGRRRGVRQRVGGDDVPEQAGGAGHHLLLVLRGGEGPSRSRAGSISARSCRTPTTSSRRSTRRSSATARSSTSRRACAARWSCRPTSASTRRTPGQFERTLIIADEGAYVSYLEGCTAPMRDENQLHAAVVELVALDDATIKYSTIQNWYPGDKDGKGGIYNFVTKRGKALDATSKITWTQVETGSAITWKYPSCILQGDDSIGEFYSVATTNNWQQADTGTKMIHLGKNTRSTIVSKGISAGHGQNTYRGAGARSARTRTDARNYSQCDSLLIGDKCGAHTFPYLEIKNTSAQGRARSVDVEDRRGPDLLLPPARHRDRRRRQHDRQRLLQGSLPRAADGVRGRSAEAAVSVSSKDRRITATVRSVKGDGACSDDMLESRTCTSASKTRRSSRGSTCR